jgi:hypothetical protein
MYSVTLCTEKRGMHCMLASLAKCVCVTTIIMEGIVSRKRYIIQRAIRVWMHSYHMKTLCCTISEL